MNMEKRIRDIYSMLYKENNQELFEMILELITDSIFTLDERITLLEAEKK